MATCKKHGYEINPITGMCLRCGRDFLAEYSNEKTGKTPLGYCNEHGYYYAKYEGYEGCPVCAGKVHGAQSTSKSSTSSIKKPYGILWGYGIIGGIIGAIFGGGSGFLIGALIAVVIGVIIINSSK